MGFSDVPHIMVRSSARPGMTEGRQRSPTYGQLHKYKALPLRRETRDGGMIP